MHFTKGGANISVKRTLPETSTRNFPHQIEGTHLQYLAGWQNFPIPKDQLIGWALQATVLQKKTLPVASEKKPTAQRATFPPREDSNEPWKPPVNWLSTVIPRGSTKHWSLRFRRVPGQWKSFNGKYHFRVVLHRFWLFKMTFTGKSTAHMGMWTTVG